MRLFIVCLLGSLGGCLLATPREVATRNAGRELGCPNENVWVLHEQSGAGDTTFDVDACGHAARYTCVWERGIGYRCFHVVK